MIATKAQKTPPHVQGPKKKTAEKESVHKQVTSARELERKEIAEKAGTSEKTINKGYNEDD